MYVMSRPRYRPPGGYWFVFHLLSPNCWPRQGVNSLAITLVSRDDAVASEPGVRDVELETQVRNALILRRTEPVGLHAVIDPRCWSGWCPPPLLSLSLSLSLCVCVCVWMGACVRACVRVCSI